MKADYVKSILNDVIKEYDGCKQPLINEESRRVLVDIIYLARVVKAEYNRKHFYLTCDGADGKEEFVYVIIDRDKSIFIDSVFMGDINQYTTSNNHREQYLKIEKKIHDFTGIYNWIFEGIKRVIDMLMKDTYSEYIRNNLPYKFRCGVVKLKDYWKYCPEDKVRRNRGYDLALVDDFIDWVEANKKLSKNNGYDQMTPSMFYEASYYIYEYFGCDVENLTPKQAYKKYADGRTMGFVDLDENYSELDKWMKIYGHGDHADEVLSNRVWMWFSKNKEGKWNFYISSVCWDGDINEQMRLILAMVKAGYHMDASYYKAMVKRFKGKCLAGISPCNATFDTMLMFENNLKLSEFVKHLDGHIPKKLMEKITWLEPRIAELEDYVKDEKGEQNG